MIGCNLLKGIYFNKSFQNMWKAFLVPNFSFKCNSINHKQFAWIKTGIEWLLIQYTKVSETNVFECFYWEFQWTVKALIYENAVHSILLYMEKCNHLFFIYNSYIYLYIRNSIVCSE